MQLTQSRTSSCCRTAPHSMLAASSAIRPVAIRNLAWLSTATSAAGVRLTCSCTTAAAAGAVALQQQHYSSTAISSTNTENKKSWQSKLTRGVGLLLKQLPAAPCHTVHQTTHCLHADAHYSQCPSMIILLAVIIAEYSIPARLCTVCLSPPVGYQLPSALPTAAAASLRSISSHSSMLNGSRSSKRRNIAARFVGTEGDNGSSYEYDAVIIGAGSAGVRAARTAAENGEHAFTSSTMRLGGFPVHVICSSCVMKAAGCGSCMLLV